MEKFEDWELARSAETDATTLDLLSTHSERNIRCMVAANPSTKQETLRKMLKDKDSYVLNSLAQNANISDDIMESLFLMTTKNSAVRISEGLAINIKTKPDMLERLAQVENSYVKYYVGRHLDTPQHVLISLLKEAKSFVKCGVASNPNITDEMAWSLAKSKNIDVILKLCKNDSVHHDILDFLALGAKNVSILFAISSNKNAKSSTLEYIYSKNIDTENPINTIAESIASNPNLPNHLIEELSNNPSAHVRWSLSTNPSISKSVLKKLLCDEEDYVRHSASKNPLTKDFAPFL